VNITMTGFNDTRPTSTVPDLSAWKANASAVLRAVLKRAFDVEMDAVRSWGLDRAIEDGTAHRCIQERQTVDLEPGEAHVLVGRVGEAGIELHAAKGEYSASIRDPRNDSYSREAWKAVTVHYEEVLSARVLKLNLHPEGYAEIEVTGEGEYWS
jgi:hypothetical protein